MKQSDLRWNVRYDLDLYVKVKPWEKRGTEPGVLKSVPNLPCRQNVSSKRKQPNMLVLRCECMADTRKKPSRRFFGYDPIGVYSSLAALQEAWKEHLNANH